MICEKCRQNKATVHLTQTRQGKTIKYNLCEHCAQQQGVNQNLSGYLGSIFGHGFGSSVFNTAGGIPAFGKIDISNIVCKACGQSFEDFRRTGLFGCSKCYSEFAEQVEPVFRRLQGSTRHIGRKLASSQRTTEKQSKVEGLREQLKQAVVEEDYEKAAHVRDEIRSLEQSKVEKGDESK